MAYGRRGYSAGGGGGAAVPADLVARLEALEAVAIPTALEWSGTALTLARSGTMEYAGSDVGVELAGVGPHAPGAVVAIKFPAGSITGEHRVTLADSMGPLDAQDDGDDFDPSLDYYVVVAALGTYQLMSTCRANVVADTAAPVITAAVIAAGAANVVALTTSEPVTCAEDTGFTVPGYTKSGISGGGTSWLLALTEPVAPEATVAVAWEATNVMRDASGNPLAAGSRAIDNGAEYPIVSGAAITPDGSQLSVTYSRAVTDADGSALELGGTVATVTGVVSGSGTATIVYDLSEEVVGGVITLAVSASSEIAATDGLTVQAATGITVASDAEYPTLVSCTVDDATATLAWSEACAASSLNLGSFTFSAGTSAAFDSLTSGDGTGTWLFALDPAAQAEEEFTLSIASGSGVVSAATGLGLQAVAGEMVTNETSAAGPAIPVGMANAASIVWGSEVSPGVWSVTVTYDWTDADQLLDWSSNTNGSLAIVDGHVVVTSTASIRGLLWDQGIAVTRVSWDLLTSATPRCIVFSHLAGAAASYNPPQNNGSNWQPTQCLRTHDGADSSDNTRHVHAETHTNFIYESASAYMRSAVADYPTTPTDWSTLNGTFVESTDGRLVIGGYTTYAPQWIGSVTIEGLVAAS